MNKIKNMFQLKQNNTTVSKELLAGATTFFAMVYIIFVNPEMLSKTGMPFGAVFLATIISAVIGTLIMGLFANVPYAQAPGMGLNAFFTYTVCMTLKFQWQEALAMVFICGIINVLITVTKVRKLIIKAIPKSLQHAIGGGIGLFIAYIGLLNANVIGFGDGIPALSKFSSAIPILAVIGILITIVLLLFRVKGAILIGIVATTLIGIPMSVTNLEGLKTWDILKPFTELGTTFGAAFGKEGMGSLFNSGQKVAMSLMAIFAFSLSDTFDTIGTFIGTGLKSGIFTSEDMDAIENSKGFKTRMEKALFADSIATSIGAIVGTSNTTTFVESATGIEAGGRTGLTSVFTALFLALCMFLSPIAAIIPSAATTAALVVVGIMMLSSFVEVKWDDLSEAIPAFFTAVMMCLTYNISYGIALGFIFYIVVKVIKKEWKQINPILWTSAGLFMIYFVLMGLFDAGIIGK